MNPDPTEIRWNHNQHYDAAMEALMHDDELLALNHMIAAIYRLMINPPASNGYERR